MNSTARFAISAIVGLSLTVYVIASALMLGFASVEMVVGLGLLTIYSLVEVAVLSYAPPAVSARSTAAAFPLEAPLRARRESIAAVRKLPRRITRRSAEALLV